MKNIICIGEILIDFICTDVDIDLIEGKTFIKRAGGAPANVAVAISKLGGTSAFAGKVGNDEFGKYLKKVLDDHNVETSMIVFDNTLPTTIAFVSLQADGERNFVFNRGADKMLDYSELNLEKLRQSTIMHFGSATALLSGVSKETYLKAMEFARKEGKFISFDPNYRSNLWKNRRNEFSTLSKKCISQADFVKLSEEELEIITGVYNKEQAVKILHSLGAKIVAVTLGKYGTFVSNGITSLIVESINIKSIDSTGAGDAFVGAVLYKLSLLENPIEAMKDKNILYEIIYFSNKVGALVCTKLGAIDALPELYEIDRLS